MPTSSQHAREQTGRKIALRVGQMALDLAFSILCLFCATVALALALIGIAVLPVMLGTLLLTRFGYWLISRGPMWFSPNSVGRLHRWPWQLNIAICILIAAVIAGAIYLTVPNSAARYTTFVFDIAWSLASGLIISAAAFVWPDSTCGPPVAVEACRAFLRAWLTIETPALCIALLLVFTFFATIFAFMVTLLSNAKRLCMIETTQPQAQGPRL